MKSNKEITEQNKCLYLYLRLMVYYKIWSGVSARQYKN